MNGRLVRDAIGIGLAGGIVGLHVYAFMTPKAQNQIQKSMKKTVDELRDLTEEITQSIHHMR